MKKIYLIFILLFSQSLKSTIVFLRGTSCAGKTSLCKEFLKLDNSWKLVDEDEVFNQTFRMHWSNIFKTEYDFLSRVIEPENIFAAIIFNEISFVPNVSNDQKNEAFYYIKKIRQIIDEKSNISLNAKKMFYKYNEKYILNLIYSYASVGYNVIVDSVFLNEAHFEKFKTDFKTIIALAYSPLDQLINRLIERNSTNNFASKRFFYHPLLSYANIYEFITTNNLETSAKKIIDKVELSSFVNSMDKVENSMKESYHASGKNNLFTRGEFSKDEFKKYKENLKSKFNNKLLCYIVPKINADIVIYTDNVSPNDCAKTLLNIIKNI